ncbi:hypothetical protein [Caulobacter sp. FWC2]|uniref:hypothetical protein n=1 Tax=Caulobacter sp. FWC2 TaxID=69664 RepID=UPI000C15F791|nr:hypothetical protein [Caulobacter sp. FWC2]PIB90995.1 hypothetical protein CSW62_05065 [Caulobacter sp. FWC2]
MLKSTRIGTGKINYVGETLEVSATLSALNRLGLEKGCDGIEAADQLQAKKHPGIAELLYYMQVNSDHSADEIYDWLFGDLTAFMENDEGVKDQVAKALVTMFGLRIAEQLPQSGDAQKKDGV